jgi:chromosome segregation ATPase
MLGFLGRLWKETYGHEKQNKQSGITVTFQNRRPVSEPRSKFFETTTPAAEPMDKNSYGQKLDGIDDFDDLEREYASCPEQFKELVLKRFRKLTDDNRDFEEIEQACRMIDPGSLKTILLNRYEQLLPEHLADVDLEKLEETFRLCQDTERFGLAIKRRYQELLSECDSLDELEERLRACPEEFNQFFFAFYQKLLYAEDSLADLEERYKNCDAFFNSLFAHPYALLLKKEDSLEALEERFQECPENCNGLVFSRYSEILQTITSIEDMAERYENCPKSMNNMILARYQELLPAAMMGLSSDEIEEFCANAEEHFQPLILTYAQQLSQLDTNKK